MKPWKHGEYLYNLEVEKSFNLEGLKYKYNYIKTFAWQNLPKTKSTFAKPKEKCLQNIKQKAN